MAVVTGAVAAVGAVAVSAYSAVQAGKASKRAGKQAQRAQEAEMSFAREKHAEWKAVYGDVQDNLAEYYKNLSPEYQASIGLEKYAAERDTALTNLRENLAQRGISDSGVAGTLETQFALHSASARAKIRADAPMRTAKEKLGFLEVGTGQQARADNFQADALNRDSTRTHDVALAAASNAGKARQAAIDSAFELPGKLTTAYDKHQAGL